MPLARLTSEKTTAPSSASGGEGGEEAPELGSGACQKERGRGGWDERQCWQDSRVGSCLPRKLPATVTHLYE